MLSTRKDRLTSVQTWLISPRFLLSSLVCAQSWPTFCQSQKIWRNFARCSSTGTLTIMAQFPMKSSTRTLLKLLVTSSWRRQRLWKWCGRPTLTKMALSTMLNLSQLRMINRSLSLRKVLLQLSKCLMKMVMVASVQRSLRVSSPGLQVALKTKRSGSELSKRLTLTITEQSRKKSSPLACLMCWVRELHSKTSTAPKSEKTNHLSENWT